MLYLSAEQLAAMQTAVAVVVKRSREIEEMISEAKKAQAVIKLSDAPAAKIVADDIELDPLRLCVKVGGRDVPLTPVEMRLLYVLLSMQGCVVDREQLIDLAWGPDYFGNQNTVDVYIRRLRAKIEKDPSFPRRIRTVRGFGFIFDRDTDRQEVAR